MARGGKPVQVYFQAGEREQLDELCEATGRSLSDEVRHAVRRHLAAPPVVVEATPELPDDVVVVKAKAGGKKKGK
jgi:hypothetical protein